MSVARLHLFYRVSFVIEAVVLLGRQSRISFMSCQDMSLNYWTDFLT